MITPIDPTGSLLRALGLHPQPRRTAVSAPSPPCTAPACKDRVEISPEAERAARAGQLQARARSEARAEERGDGTKAGAAAPAPDVRGRLVDLSA